MRKPRPPESTEMSMWTWEPSTLMGGRLGLARTVSRGEIAWPQPLAPDVAPAPCWGSQSGFGSTGDSTTAVKKQIQP